jgi:alpha-L-rhamnosidase
VAYAGTALSSRQQAWWRVRVTDQTGAVSAWSAAATFEAALQPADWTAAWIGMTTTNGAAPHLRREFTIAKPVARARAYVCGLGFHELHLNGAKVSDRVLDPGFTDYRKTALYVVHDITASINQGTNAIGVVLGNGWYNNTVTDTWNFQTAPWKGVPRLRMQIHVDFTDGTTQVVATDTTWKARTGPITFSQVRNGEYYDARLGLGAWDAAGYDDSAWVAAQVQTAPAGTLRPMLSPPCRVIRTVVPVSVTKVGASWIVDLGENIVGWARISVAGTAGTQVSLAYSEVLAATQLIDQSTISVGTKSGVFQTDRYTLSGAGVETWEPRFVWHGFRYIQVDGWPGTLSAADISGRFVSTDLGAGATIATSDAAGVAGAQHQLLDAIVATSRRSFQGNWVMLPTDCPHREKLGWTADARNGHEIGAWLCEPSAFAHGYRKYLRDIRETQIASGDLACIAPTPGWGYTTYNNVDWCAALAQIAWRQYVLSGDRRLLTDNWPAIRAYTEFIRTQRAVGNLVSTGLGDWTAAQKPPIQLTSSLIYLDMVRATAAIAGVLGNTADASTYDALAASIAVAINQGFYNSGTGLYATTGVQCAQAGPLALGIVPDAQKAAVISGLNTAITAANTHVTVGALGMPWIFDVLSGQGLAQTAWNLASANGSPGYAHMLSWGGGTWWEYFNVDQQTAAWNKSRNHIFLGKGSAWAMTDLAGIRPDALRPGFQRALIHPRRVAGFDRLACTVPTLYGPFVVSETWSGSVLSLHATVPGNAQARVWIPTSDAGLVREGGVLASTAAGVAYVGMDGDAAIFEIGSGDYTFTIGTATNSRPTIASAAQAGPSSLVLP